jgi:hypothetical protein
LELPQCLLIEKSTWIIQILKDMEIAKILVKKLYLEFKREFKPEMVTAA